DPPARAHASMLATAISAAATTRRRFGPAATRRPLDVAGVAAPRPSIVLLTCDDRLHPLPARRQRQGPLQAASAAATVSTRSSWTRLLLTRSAAPWSRAWSAFAITVDPLTITTRVAGTSCASRRVASIP